jgi:nucleoside-diphosphate-sugar epimerase
VGAYGTTHLAASRLVELAWRAQQVDGVTLRVFNPIGSGIRGDTVIRRAAVRIHEASESGSREIRMGALSAFRDFVDARDVAAAVVSASFLPIRWPTINIGSGRAVQVREAVRMLARQAAFDGLIHEESAPPHRSSGVDWIAADIGRATEGLGWRPERSLAESLAEVWTDVA